jgi:hypothetical protein
MKLFQYEIKELEKKIYDLITRTTIELGHKTDAKTMVTLTKIFTKDLQKEKRFRNLTFNDIDIAFDRGVRVSESQQFMNIPTFYRWCRIHKQRINEAYYEVDTMGRKPEEVEYYNEIKKIT